MAELEAQTHHAVATRQAILGELLALHPWRFSLAVSAELHLALHMFWFRPEVVTRVARAVDAALGAHLAALPADADIAVFSVMGMTACYTDLTCNLFLPEFLYRLQFGAAALAEGDPAAPVPAAADHYRRHWREEVWALRTPRGERDLESPELQGARNDPFDWTPLNWYRPLWPRMRAFALPSFSHGLVRLNLRGRDPQGMVDPADYARTCSELAEAILTLRNPRTGGPLVKTVTRTRNGPEDEGAYAPPGDLMVTWNEREPADVAESPRVGRIGPAPWLRPGGHGPDGFCILAGPGISPGSRIREGARLMDLTATLTARLDLPAPAHLEGRSLVSPP
jgi:predicted AlkP superfamily phosphohydrolase/phosphomutase